MPARKLVPLVTNDIAVKIESTHESSPAPSDISTSSIIGKRKASHQICPDMDKEKKRKLMNRVAAQQSRDRKRQHMEFLESELKRLKTENEKLKTENLTILEEKNRLEQENNQIKKHTVVKTENIVSQDSVSSTFEPAEFINDLLPQGQVDRTRLLQTLLICLAQFLQLKTNQNCVTFSPSFENSVEERVMDVQLLQRVTDRCASIIRQQKHWGPHQQAWNPSKNSCYSQISITPLS